MSLHGDLPMRCARCRGRHRGATYVYLIGKSPPMESPAEPGRQRRYGSDLPRNQWTGFSFGRHRDTFDAMATPLDGAPELPRLPAVPLELLSRDREHRNLPAAARARTLGAEPGDDVSARENAPTGVNVEKFQRRTGVSTLRRRSRANPGRPATPRPGATASWCCSPCTRAPC